MSFTPFAPVSGSGLPPGLVPLAPSGDATGVKDTNAITAALAGLPDGLGAVLLGPGNWYVAAGADIPLPQGQGVQGLAGAGSTFITAVGSTAGPVFSFAPDVTFTGGQYASPFSGMSILGYGTGAESTALAASGLQGQRVRDLYLAGFPGGLLDLTNASDTYAEQGSWKDLVLVQGGSESGWMMRLNGSSFDYTVWEVVMVCEADVHGLLLENGAQMRGGRFELRGNFYGGVTNTGAVIAVDPGNAGGTSYVDGSIFFGQVESAGTGTGHFTLLMGSANSTSQFTGMGALKFVNEAIDFQGYSNDNFVPVGFMGILEDTVLGAEAPGNSMGVVGGSLWRANGSLSGAPGGGDTVYFQFGDVVEFRLASGDNALSFQGAPGGQLAQKADLWIAQPASGAPGTITWPTMKWPGETPPTLSTGNGDVDHLRVTWLPDTASWYGELVDLAYA